MRGAIAQQEDQRNLIKTPVKRRDADSDDDSEDAHDSLLSSTETDERFGILEGKWSSNYVRNPRTKSIMHYAGENSFYRNLHTSIVCVDEPKPDEKVFFKHVKSKQSIPLVTRSGNLAKNPSVTFQGSVSKGDDNVVESFKKVFKASIQRSTSKGDSSPLGHENSLDDMDGVALAQWNSDRSWIFGGSGRWSVLSPERINPESHSSPSSKSRSAFASPVSPSIPNFSSALSSSLKSKAPAAVSMANPEVVTDAATEASEPFAFQMINQSSWAFDELAYQAGASGAVSLLLPDATERFLVAGTKDGEMKVWSLSSNPLVELMKYSSHQTSIISAGFLKSGTHVASCDGSIRIWDIERGMTIADLQKSHSEMNAFCHLEVVSPRFGVGSDMSKHGDDQLATCAGTVLAHYDTRVGYASTLNPISEWKIVSTLAGGNDSSYPIALTCSASNEKYVCVASANGTLWAYDRRTGRPIHCWTGHEGLAVLKICYVDEHQILTFSEKSSICWSLRHSEPVKLYSLKGLPECSTPINHNSILISSFEDPSKGVSQNFNRDIGDSSRQVQVVYCLAGHKASAGRLTRVDCTEKASESEVRLEKSSFHDSSMNKLGKSRLHICSAAMLPLRRLMLVGTNDGLIRTIT